MEFGSLFKGLEGNQLMNAMVEEVFNRAPHSAHSVVLVRKSVQSEFDSVETFVDSCCLIFQLSSQKYLR